MDVEEVLLSTANIEDSDNLEHVEVVTSIHEDLPETNSSNTKADSSAVLEIKQEKNDDADIISIKSEVIVSDCDETVWQNSEDNDEEDLCEVKFQSPSNLARKLVAMFDCKSGNLVNVSVDHACIRKSAASSQTAEQQDPTGTSPEKDPDEHPECFDNHCLHTTFGESVSHKQSAEQFAFNDVTELLSKYKLDNKWVLVKKPDGIYFVLINDTAHPKVSCYVFINDCLEFNVYFNDVHVTRIGNTKLPVLVTDVNKLNALLNKTYDNFFKLKFSTEEKLDLIKQLTHSLYPHFPNDEDVLGELVGHVSLLNNRIRRQRQQTRRAILGSQKSNNTLRPRSERKTAMLKRQKLRNSQNKKRLLSGPKSKRALRSLNSNNSQKNVTTK